MDLSAHLHHYLFQFLLSPDPTLWGSAARADVPEDDDYLHNPDPRRDKNIDSMGTIFTARGLANIGCLAIVFVGLLGLLYVPAFPCYRLNYSTVEF